jgi:hypothetical protein
MRDCDNDQIPMMPDPRSIYENHEHLCQPGSSQAKVRKQESYKHEGTLKDDLRRGFPPFRQGMLVEMFPLDV